jgi:hypothetical protein
MTRGRAVTLRPRPLWRIRLIRGLPRYVLYAVAAMGVLVSARMTIAPPSPARAPRPAAAGGADRVAEGYAVLFARDYLTWNADSPDTSASALERFAGSGLEASIGLQLPDSGEQRVEWAEVVQTQERTRGRHLYTVAAQTNDAGTVYLAVPVTRTATGAVALDGYPSFVGPPLTSPAQTGPVVSEVDNPALATVVQRALRNYLASAPSELAADLTPSARVSLPAMPMTMEGLQRLDWTQGSDSVIATVRASDTRGVRYTLEYELAVEHTQDRWEIAAMQTGSDG